MNLDLDKFLAEPIDELKTSTGLTLYIYPLTSLTLGLAQDLGKCAEEDKGNRVVAALVSTVKRHRHSDGSPPPISAEIFESLGEPDIQRIVGAVKADLEKRRADQAKKRGFPPIPQSQPDEHGAKYLARLAEYDIAVELAASRRIMDQALAELGAPMKSALEALNASTSVVTSRISEFRRQNKAPSISHAPDILQDEYFAQIAQERQEQRRWARETSEMTTASAEMLTHLVAASKQFMAGIDVRDREAKKSVRSQVWIGVGSLVCGAILSAVSLYYSRESLMHDLSNDSAAAKAADVIASQTAARAASDAARFEALLSQNAKLIERNELLLHALAATHSTEKQPVNSK